MTPGPVQTTDDCTVHQGFPVYGTQCGLQSPSTRRTSCFTSALSRPSIPRERARAVCLLPFHELHCEPRSLPVTRGHWHYPGRPPAAGAVCTQAVAKVHSCQVPCQCRMCSSECSSRACPSRGLLHSAAAEEVEDRGGTVSAPVHAPKFTNLSNLISLLNRGLFQLESNQA